MYDRIILIFDVLIIDVNYVIIDEFIIDVNYLVTNVYDLPF